MKDAVILTPAGTDKGTGDILEAQNRAEKVITL